MIEASTVSADTALSVGVGVLIALAGALWKLASMLSAIRADTTAIREDTSENRQAIGQLENRVTDHRRRQEAQALLLREHIDQRIDSLTQGLTVEDALRSIRHELGTIPDEHPDTP